MYFIQRGTVEVLASLGPRMFTVCATLQAKEHFGLHQGFIPDVRSLIPADTSFRTTRLSFNSIQRHIFQLFSFYR